METKAGISKIYTNGFMLDEQKFRKLSDVLKEHAAKLLPVKTTVVYHVHRKDDSFYESTDISQVLADDNSAPKEISSLFIELHKDKPEEIKVHGPDEARKPIVLIGFNPKKKEKVRFLITGDNRDWCFLLADDLDSQIKRTLQTKIPTLFQSHLLDAILMMASLSAIGIFVAVRASKAGIPPINPSMTLDGKVDLILQLVSQREAKRDLPFVIGLMTAMPFVLLVMASRPFSRCVSLYYRPVFYWGDQIAAHDNFQGKVYIAKWVLGAALLVGLVVNFLSKKFF